MLCKSRDEDLEIFKLSNAGPSKKESICQICEQPGELITCEGACLGSFHYKCLGLITTPVVPFKCEECVSGKTNAAKLFAISSSQVE